MRSSTKRCAFSALQIAHRSLTSPRWSTRSGLSGRRLRSNSAVTPTWPSTGTVTGWKRPSAIGSKSTCTIGLYGAIPVWFENDAPNTSRRSDSFISQLATGVPLRPSTPAPSGCRSDTSPFALNVVSTGAPNASANATTAAISNRAPWPATMTGRFACSINASASWIARAGGSIRSSATRPMGAEGRAPAGAASSCTSSGRTRCATLRPTIACLSASVMSSAWSDSGSTVCE